MDAVTPRGSVFAGKVLALNEVLERTGSPDTISLLSKSAGTRAAGAASSASAASCAAASCMWLDP